MNIDPNKTFPNPHFFDNIFSDIFLKNPTIDLVEENEEDIHDQIFQPSPILQQNPQTMLSPNPPLIQRNNLNIFHVERREIRLGKYSTHKINKQILYHFLKFLINFCNDALEEENLNIHYPNDSGLIKFLFPQRYYIFYSHFNLKEKTIEDILKLDIPAQLPIFGDGNRKLLEKIGSLSPRLTNLFKMKVLKLFKYYYNKEKPLNKISFENKEIYLSPRTKTFYDLLGKKKNRLKEFILVAKNYYLLEKNDS